VNFAGGLSIRPCELMRLSGDTDAATQARAIASLNLEGNWGKLGTLTYFA
jgi:hypothetical protein